MSYIAVLQRTSGSFGVYGVQIDAVNADLTVSSLVAGVSNLAFYGNSTITISGMAFCESAQCLYGISYGTGVAGTAYLVRINLSGTPTPTLTQIPVAVYFFAASVVGSDNLTYVILQTTTQNQIYRFNPSGVIAATLVATWPRSFATLSIPFNNNQWANVCIDSNVMHLPTTTTARIQVALDGSNSYSTSPYVRPAGMSDCYTGVFGPYPTYYTSGTVSPAYKWDGTYVGTFPRSVQNGSPFGAITIAGGGSWAMVQASYGGRGFGVTEQASTDSIFTFFSRADGIGRTTPTLDFPGYVGALSDGAGGAYTLYEAPNGMVFVYGPPISAYPSTPSLYVYPSAGYIGVVPPTRLAWTDASCVAGNGWNPGTLLRGTDPSTASAPTAPPMVPWWRNRLLTVET
jgi:hypothetical protein